MYLEKPNSHHYLNIVPLRQKQIQILLITQKEIQILHSGSIKYRVELYTKSNRLLKLVFTYSLANFMSLTLKRLDDSLEIIKKLYAVVLFVVIYDVFILYIQEEKLG